MTASAPEILHITPHLGGGVGRVLLNYLAGALRLGQRHRLVCLDSANPEAVARARELGLPLADRLGRDHLALNQAVADADLAVIHWWNHPLLYHWLTHGLWPPARVALWSHVAGFTAPQITTPALAAFPDILAVASPVSFRLPALATWTGADRSARLRLIFSSGGLAHVADARPRPHRGFRVGYLGTVDPVKMHPRFLDLCLSAGLPAESVFTVAGGPEHRALEAETVARGLAGFEILGPIGDVAGFLSHLDVFGYPLNPEHYGTGEQVLIETQAAGVPPVVLAGGAEEYVVEHERTGLVARDLDDYGRCLRRLYDQPELRARLSAAAARRSRERFSLEATVRSFDALYAELLARPRRERAWPGLEEGRAPAPWHVFLTSQGPAAALYERLESGAARPEDFTRAAFSPTRGSVFHYAAFFPEDERLRAWADRLAGLARGGD